MSAHVTGIEFFYRRLKSYNIKFFHSVHVFTYISPTYKGRFVNFLQNVHVLLLYICISHAKFMFISGAAIDWNILRRNIYFSQILYHIIIQYYIAQFFSIFTLPTIFRSTEIYLNSIILNLIKRLSLMYTVAVNVSTMYKKSSNEIAYLRLFTQLIIPWLIFISTIW